MSVFSTIGGVAKIVLGGATAADGFSDLRKEKKRKAAEAQAKDTFYEGRIEEIETEDESEEETAD